MNDHASRLLAWIEEKTDSELARPSRIHPLPSSADASLWIKREDELSSGISGSKLRKYASLIPSLRAQGVEEVGLIGGPNSNNLVGLLQILKENNIRPWLFLREAGDETKLGNALFMDLLCPRSNQRIISRADWPQAESIALGFLQQRRRKTLLVTEGALQLESLPGALTLAQDLLRNERSCGLRFENVFVDSGTGMTAIGLILGLAYLDSAADSRHIDVTLIAGKQKDFEGNLETFQKQLAEALRLGSPSLPKLAFHSPVTCPSFGSVKPSLFKACREIARAEGLLMDPVYSAKHYLTAQRIRADREESGAAISGQKSLFIFNGSPLGLCGFQRQLSAMEPST